MGLCLNHNDLARKAARACPAPCPCRAWISTRTILVLCADDGQRGAGHRSDGDGDHGATVEAQLQIDEGFARDVSLNAWRSWLGEEA
jgi:hypothetical protein